MVAKKAMAAWRAGLLSIICIGETESQRTSGSALSVCSNQIAGSVTEDWTFDYVVIGRGGVFGFDEKYVPVPWNAFKMAKGALLLVLDSSKANMDSAPQMKEKMFAADVNFGRDNEKADDYWKTHASQ